MLTLPTSISALDGRLGGGNLAARLGTSAATSQSFASMGVAPNVALFFPIKIPVAGTILKLWTMNGAAVAGNLDIGVYDGVLGRAVNRLVSAGSTAQAGTNAKQIFDIADTFVAPGTYYIAVAVSDQAATLFTVSVQGNLYTRLHGCSQQATALPLPSTHTWAAMTGPTIPDIGISFRPLI